ncbi:glycosyltransferase family 4 protein [Halorientalis pallida]|uniref:Glycosyltransferase WbuB n=1 Tax=Halorientalis pallida TaxID=2479928 RepID=A0A498KSF5_9EURY|nr:glycosyltransferase family 4 protein [Halorientalis pallida]RXK47448.1 glycosyltransferase WbuB [Halorientalis pallida]
MSDTDGSITLLTEYFYPEEASTAQLLTRLTTRLEAHFDVSVVTAYPNYHDEDRSETVPKRSVHDGVNISRVRGTRFDKDSLPLRVLNWLSFSLLALVRLFSGRSERDVLFVLSNPPILPFVAWVYKRLRGTPYVYLIYDMYPDMPIALGLLSDDGIIAQIWERAMVVIYRDADRIVVLGDSMERRLLEKMEEDSAFDPEKIEVIPNWEDETFIKPMAKEDNDFAVEHDTIDPFTLLYSGNIGRFHELETAIEAIAQLKQQGRMDIQLLVIGEGAKKDELRRMVDRRDIENVQFFPFQPLERLPETLTCGDASLVGIQPEMEGMCVSSKLYSSLAAGMPVLAVVGEGDEVARVVREHDCGAYVRPGDVDATATILQRWADDDKQASRLGRNARSCFEARYTLDHAAEEYTELFQTLLDTRSG